MFPPDSIDCPKAPDTEQALDKMQALIARYKDSNKRQALPVLTEIAPSGDIPLLTEVMRIDAEAVRPQRPGSCTPLPHSNVEQQVTSTMAGKNDATKRPHASRKPQRQVSGDLEIIFPEDNAQIPPQSPHATAVSDTPEPAEGATEHLVYGDLELILNDEEQSDTTELTHVEKSPTALSSQQESFFSEIDPLQLATAIRKALLPELAKVLRADLDKQFDSIRNQLVNHTLIAISPKLERLIAKQIAYKLRLVGKTKK